MTRYCPVDGIVDTIGKKYAPQIVGVLGARAPPRYGELAESLGLTSSSLPSERLEELVDEGLLECRSFDEIPPRVEYSLTSKGREFDERIQPLLEWAASRDERRTRGFATTPGVPTGPRLKRLAAVFPRMRVGLISDIHANRVALDAVLEDMPAVDRLVCAGDVVGYNPWPAECVDAMRDGSAPRAVGVPGDGEVPTVMGNHDRAVVSDTAFGFNRMAQAGVDYARERLSAEQLEWLSTLPTERLVCDGRVKLVHGHPADPDRYTYPEEFHPGMLGDEDVLVLGHTHVQGHAVYEEGVVCNPGSVGQPRDGDPRAGYAVVDLEALAVEEHRVSYDIDEVMEAVRGMGLPERIGRRLYEGR